MISPYQFSRVSAACGALFWLLTFPVRTGDSPETDLIERVFLFAVFVIVPLAVSLIAKSENWIALRYAIWAQPLGALLCFASFVLSQGVLAGALASLWLATTTLIALAGLTRIFLVKRIAGGELAISFGMIYVSIGGAWLVASRLGLQPFGFGDTIVLLTAVHFHFAGFAAPILAGLAGRAVQRQRVASIAIATAAILVVLGTPIVAAGITFSPTLALAGTLTVTAGLALLGIAVIASVVPAINSRLSKSLLVVASLSSITAMILASLYAYSIVTRTVIIDIPHMAMTHGLLNAFGFALCGLLAWTFSSLPQT